MIAEERNKTATCCWRNGDSQHGVETCQVIKEFHRMFGMPPLQLAVTHTATFCTAGLCWWNLDPLGGTFHFLGFPFSCPELWDSAGLVFLSTLSGMAHFLFSHTALSNQKFKRKKISVTPTVLTLSNC